MGENNLKEREYMKVYQLENHNGNAWANQFVIHFDKYNISILQSYKSLVALLDYKEHHITLGDDYDYSNTTARAVRKFMADNGITAGVPELRKALKSGELIDDYGETWSVASGCDSFFEDFFTIGEK